MIDFSSITPEARAVLSDSSVEIERHWTTNHPTMISEEHELLVFGVLFPEGTLCGDNSLHREHLPEWYKQIHPGGPDVVPNMIWYRLPSGQVLCANGSHGQLDVSEDTGLERVGEDGSRWEKASVFDQIWTVTLAEGYIEVDMTTYSNGKPVPPPVAWAGTTVQEMEQAQEKDRW